MSKKDKVNQHYSEAPMFKMLTLFFALIFSINSLAQSDLSAAKQQLHQMKNGVLLVRLFTEQSKIDGLKAQGKISQAERVAQQQYQINRDILLSFSQVFEFCPVFFFYSKDSEAIRNGDFKGKVFDVSQRLVDPSEIKGTVFTAEFSETANTGIDGLIIMDDQLFPLSAPFPHYQREHTFFGMVSLPKSKMVHRLNNKLRDTYYLWFPDSRE